MALDLEEIRFRVMLETHPHCAHAIITMLRRERTPGSSYKSVSGDARRVKFLAPLGDLSLGAAARDRGPVCATV